MTANQYSYYQSAPSIHKIGKYKHTTFGGILLKTVFHTWKFSLMQHSKHYLRHKAMMYLDVLQVFTLVMLISLKISLQLNKAVPRLWHYTITHAMQKLLLFISYIAFNLDLSRVLCKHSNLYDYAIKLH